MHILIMGQHFAPEEVSGAILATELATGLSKKGHQVTFVTCTPNYPYGKPYPGYSNRLYFREQIQGVKLVRIWSYLSPHKTLVRRLFNYTTFSLFAFYGGLTNQKIDVMISSSPPFPLGISAYLLSRWWKIPWVLRVEDLFPDLLLSMGILRPSWITNILYKTERFLYQKASHVAVISEGFRRNLRRKGIPEQKISVIPVWSDPDQVTPMSKDNSLCVELALTGRFVILYAGNLGLTAALDDLLIAAEKLSKYPEIIFLIAGEGVRKTALQKSVESDGLKNVVFIPYQPRKRYPELLALANLSVVTLNKASSHHSLPGKTFNIMASGRPILAITDPQSELGQVVNKFGCGVVIPEGQPGELADKIVTLLSAPDDLREMGRKGREAILTTFNRNRCIDLFDQLLQQLTDVRPRS